MPNIGFGTYQLNENELEISLCAALDAGYLMFDTATSYNNECYIGNILNFELKKRGLSRSDVFITSKLSPRDQGYENTIIATKRSASLLGGYVDMYLIHWPGASKVAPSSDVNAAKRLESWRALCDLLNGNVESSSPNIVRAIGVSNFNVSHLADISSNSLMMPMVNQVELHVCHHPLPLVQYCREHGIHLQSYSTLGNGALLLPSFVQQFPRLKDISSRCWREHSLALVRTGCVADAAEDEEASASKYLIHVYLKWAVQSGYSVIPKSRDPVHILFNQQALAYGPLGLEDFDYLDCLQFLHSRKYCWDSSVVR